MEEVFHGDTPHEKHNYEISEHAAFLKFYNEIYLSNGRKEKRPCEKYDVNNK